MLAFDANSAVELLRYFVGNVRSDHSFHSLGVHIILVSPALIISSHTHCYMTLIWSHKRSRYFPKLRHYRRLESCAIDLVVFLGFVAFISDDDAFRVSVSIEIPP